MIETKQSILEILKLSTAYLEKYNLPSPRLEAELLISHALGCKRLDLYLRFDQPLPEKALELIRLSLKRRSAHEPIQHIIGNTEFYNCTIKSDKRALIPRDDTEILLDEVLKIAKATVSPRILDIGTGSGCIAVSLAKALDNTVKIAAIDISEDALALAAENASNNGVTEQIIFARCDILKPFKTKEKFDIVVSNPPYIAANEMDGLDKEVKDFEPRNALTDGQDGLVFYRRLAEIAPLTVKPNGWLIVEIGYQQAESVKQIFNQSGCFIEITLIKDMSGNDRVIKAKLLKEN